MTGLVQVSGSELSAGQRVVVHHVHVEFVEHLGDPGRVHHLGKRLPEPVALRIRPERYEPVCLGEVLAHADQGDLMPAVSEIVDEVSDHRLHTAVSRRGNVEIGRRHHGDA